MTRVARWLAALTLGAVLIGLAPDAAPARVRATNVAGITVSYGDGRLVRRTVSFTSGSISGLEALQRAGFAVEVYGYGTLGAAVCRIDGVGRAADAACLNDPEGRYWAYFRNGVYSRAGASTTRVADGDQEQWAWGAGTKAPPTTAFPAPTTAPPPPPPTQPPPTNAAPTTAGTGGSEGEAPRSTGGASSSTTSAPATSAPSSTIAPSPDEADPGGQDPGGDGTEEAAGRLASATGPAEADDGGGGSPLALAAFGAVLAAVVALTLRARSARGSVPPRN